eukprot:6212343-Pleurochrysis_carterae.AAC.5
MSAMYVLGTRVVLWIVCEVDGALIVQVKRRRLAVAGTELVEKRAQEDSATEGCFLLLQSESENPVRGGLFVRAYRSPTDRWCDRYKSTRLAALSMSIVGQDMVRQSMPTAWAMSGRLARSAGSGATPASLARIASSTRRGRLSAAGAWFLWKEDGIPSGRYVSTSWAMYFSCLSKMHSASVVMSTFKSSETGPSSSTFQREDRAVVKDVYNE